MRIGPVEAGREQCGMPQQGLGFDEVGSRQVATSDAQKPENSCVSIKPAGWLWEQPLIQSCHNTKPWGGLGDSLKTSSQTATRRKESGPKKTHLTPPETAGDGTIHRTCVAKCSLAR